MIHGFWARSSSIFSKVVFQLSWTSLLRANHVQPPVFAKTPSKNKAPPPQKNYCKSPLEPGFGFFGDDDGGHFVLVFAVEDLGAPNLRKLSDY